MSRKNGINLKSVWNTQYQDRLHYVMPNVFSTLKQRFNIVSTLCPLRLIEHTCKVRYFITSFRSLSCFLSSWTNMYPSTPTCARSFLVSVRPQRNDFLSLFFFNLNDQLKLDHQCPSSVNVI